MLAIDFAALPPEINSTLMYSGPGSSPMLAAAAAWDGLAVELNTTATACESAVSSLTSEAWVGPAAAAMDGAAAPYVAWMHTAAAQAAETAAQAKVAAAAYEVAFGATVPPAVVAANRALLASLIATNLLGQNTAAIATTQAEYAGMWAQDAAAMYGYSASAAGATELTPLTPPKQVANPGGQGTQAAAVAQAAGDAAANNTQNALAGVPQALQQLALPLQAAPAAAAVVDPGVGDAAVSGLSLSSAYHTAIGSANFFQRLASQFGFMQPQTTDIKGTVDKIALATGAVESEEGLEPDFQDPLHGFGSWKNWLNFLKGTHVFHTSATASMGEAPVLAGLSVPQAWSAAAPDVQLASAESPGTAVDAAPTAGHPGAGSLGAQAALAAMAGRALVGAVAPGLGGARSTGRERGKPSGGAAKEIAEALREYASLRDAGIITEVEFNKHKERLMSLDPLSGR